MQKAGFVLILITFLTSYQCICPRQQNNFWNELLINLDKPGLAVLGNVMVLAEFMPTLCVTLTHVLDCTDFILKVLDPMTKDSSWWPRQMPKSGFGCSTQSTFRRLLMVAWHSWGSPGPLLTNKPSKSAGDNSIKNQQ